ncbi:MAG: phosphohistidine phosphatase SixA [Candidatus Marsarchaeota archaeon]|nr:phosphohistidine phosphatase SixA [Candidatus Marsarchaeota archaeon]
MRYLYLLRHAKSLWSDAAVVDFDRPLSDRGQRDAKKMSAYLKRSGVQLDLVLCSSSRRTTETFQAIAPALGPAKAVMIEDALYTFDVNHILQRLSEVTADTKSVMVIGHNPGIQALAVLLTRPSSLKSQISLKYPTAALTVVTLDNKSWDLSEPLISRTEFIAPTDLG